jgi:hypothetical protein
MKIRAAIHHGSGSAGMAGDVLDGAVHPLDLTIHTTGAAPW